MTENDEEHTIVIATTECERALYTILKDGMIYDRLELNFTEKYAPTVEYLLRMLRKSAGWLERDRGEKQVTNTRCNSNNHGMCAHTENMTKRGVTTLKCTEAIRATCPFYNKKFQTGINVQFVIIEKAGGIRNL